VQQHLPPVDVEGVLRTSESIVKSYETALSRLDFVHGIDEVAFMLDPSIAAHFVNDMVRHPNVIHFNGATCYNVEYEFLSVVGKETHGYRLECMTLGNGHSPIHEALRHNMKNDPSAVFGEYTPIIAHASFKLEDEQSYGVAVHRLQEGGWESLQRCESEYGRFSYWQPREREEWFKKGTPWVALKPRVNLRDEQEALA
jgi:hypothetical protein